MEAQLRSLSLSEKQYLKERLEDGFQEEEIELNNMSFLHDEQRGVVVVSGLIRGDAIDGLEFLVPDFVGMVKMVLADVPIYHSEEEKADALRAYLADLPDEEQLQLQRQLPTLNAGQDIELSYLEFLYDDERDSVVVNVEEQSRQIDQFELSLGDFIAVVREVVGGG